MSVNLYKLFTYSVFLSCALCALLANLYGKDKSIYKLAEFTNVLPQPVFFRSNIVNYSPTPSNSKDFAKTFNVILKKCGFKNPQAYIPTQESVYKNASLVWSDQYIHVTGLLFGRVDKNKRSKIINDLIMNWSKQCGGWFGRKTDNNIIYKLISIETTFFACVTDNETSYNSIVLFKKPGYDTVVLQWSKSSEDNLRRTTELIKIKISEMLGNIHLIWNH